MLTLKKIAEKFLKFATKKLLTGLNKSYETNPSEIA